MRKSSHPYIEQIQKDPQIIEHPHNEGASEDRICLVEKYKNNFLKSGYRFTRSDIKSSLKETVGKFKKRVTESYQKANEKIERKSVLIIYIEEIQIIDPRCIADKSAERRYKGVEEKVTEKTFPGLVFSKDPLPVSEVFSKVHGAGQSLTYMYFTEDTVDHTCNNGRKQCYIHH